MRKSIVVLVVVMAFVLVCGAAQTADFIGEFDVSASIPAATQVVFVISRVTEGTPPVWEDYGTGSKALPFTMEYIAEDDEGNPLGIWLPEKFYAIDLSPQSAANDPAPGVPDLQIEYTDSLNPNGSPGDGTGLEEKGVITVVKVTKAGTTETETTIYNDTYGSIVTPEPIDESQFAGGWGRVYLGIANGKIGTVGKPFTNSDEPGSYEGTIELTATLD